MKRGVSGGDRIGRHVRVGGGTDNGDNDGNGGDGDYEQSRSTLGTLLSPVAELAGDNGGNDNGDNYVNGSDGDDEQSRSTFGSLFHRSPAEELADDNGGGNGNGDIDVNGNEWRPWFPEHADDAATEIVPKNCDCTECVIFRARLNIMQQRRDGYDEGPLWERFYEKVAAAQRATQTTCGNWRQSQYALATNNSSSSGNGATREEQQRRLLANVVAAEHGVAAAARRVAATVDTEMRSCISSGECGQRLTSAAAAAADDAVFQRLD
jgi:hypothetical protein